MTKPIFFFFIVSSFFNLNQIQAAACCGGGSQLPALITSDDRQTFNYGMSYGQTVVDSVNADGIWIQSQEHLTTQNYKFETAYVFDNNWQIGTVIPFVKKNYLGEVYSGLSDVQVHTGYEFLPEFEYNPYKPKGFVFMGVVFPTGQSQLTSEHQGMDSRGKEQWAVTYGLVLVKTWTQFDALFQFEGHYAPAQKLNSQSLDHSSGDIRVSSRSGYQAGAGIGFNTEKFRWGGMVQTVLEEPQKVNSSILNESGYREQYTNLTASISYMLSDTRSLSISYTDQTVLGDPKNTSLSKSLALQFNQRIMR